MSKEIVWRGVGIIRALYLRTIGYLQRRVIQSQKEDLTVRLKKEELELFENSNESLPTLAQFRFWCENASDIPFEIERVRLWIELKTQSEHLPKRSNRATFPVATIDEDAYSIRHDTIGRVDGRYTTVGHRGHDGNTRLYDVEFEVPPWFGEITKVYVFGFVELQRKVYKPFKLTIDEGYISTK